MVNFNTLRAVTGQLETFDLPLYDVVFERRKDVKDQVHKYSDLTLDNILDSDWLTKAAKLNSAGFNAYLRPAISLGSHPFIFLDDLDDAKLKILKKDLTPALVVESSPQNYQIWLRFDRPLDPAERLSLTKSLAKNYGTDLGAASSTQAGRLCGFTNRKPSRILANGQSPFVLLRGTSLEVNPTPTIRTIQTPTPLNLDFDSIENPISSTEAKTLYDAFAEGLGEQRIHGPHRGLYNQSVCDFGVVCRAHRAGHSPEEIAQILLHGSPDVVQRKGKNLNDWIAGTIANAIAEQQQKAEQLKSVRPSRPARSGFDQGGD